MDENEKINERQKLAALAMRFYQGMKWEPKVGDYYCLTRDGLELFQIRSSDGENFFLRKVGPNDAQDLSDAWPIADFQTGFGINRVWVHPVILEKVK